MMGPVLLLSIKIKCWSAHLFIDCKVKKKKVDLDFENTGAILTWQSFAKVC